MSEAVTMPTIAPADPAIPAKRSRVPLIVGLVLAVLGGAGGFYVTSAGLLGASDASADVDQALDAHGDPIPETGDIPVLAPTAFVPLPPLLVNLPGEGAGRFLRFVAQLEVAPQYLDEVTVLTPRIVDVLNGYLRAVELADIEDPSALMLLRAQMLRRVQVVAGGDRVRDLLVMEFVVN